VSKAVITNEFPARSFVELPVIEALDAEWSRLQKVGHIREALAEWGRVEPLLSGYSDFADLERASWAPDLDARDDMLLALIRRAQDPAEPRRLLAARCVLQLLRRGLLHTVWELARRRRHTPADEIAVALFGAAHEVVVSFRATAGRRRVAANLLRGARKLVVTRGLLPAEPERTVPDPELHRPRNAEPVDEAEALAERDALIAGLAAAIRDRIIEPDDPAVARRAACPDAAPDARDELLALLVAAVAARALSAEDARLTAASTRPGLGYPQLAAAFGLSEPTVRKRRSRAVARLAKFVGAGGHKPALAGA
jgi:hypothetical protein